MRWLKYCKKSALRRAHQNALIITFQFSTINKRTGGIEDDHIVVASLTTLKYENNTRINDTNYTHK